jgi:hypothetical protein
MEPQFLVWLVLAAAVLAHFAFLVFLPVGGFMALRWRRLIWLHAAVVLWATASVTWRLECPLTAVERWARPRAGLPPLGPAGFIDHYLTGVFFPAGGIWYAQALVFTAVVVSWIAYATTGKSRDIGRLVLHRRGTR